MLQQLVESGFAAVRAREFAAALAAFDAALLLTPDHAAARCGRGVVLFEPGKYADALPELDRAVQLDPHDGRAREYRGRTYQELDRHDEAVAELTEAIRLGWENDNVWS